MAVARAGAVGSTVVAVDQVALLAPLEGALRAMSWGLVLFAAGLALARLT